jgi:beta-mannosidase
MRIVGLHVIVMVGICWGILFSVTSAAEAPLAQPLVVEGKFGTALDAARSAAEAKSLPEYKKLPLTVELWCKLNGSSDFNILIAQEPKESSDHWELYTENNGAGTLSAFLPGMTPSIIKSPKAIADGRWHYVAMVLEANSIVLCADGKEVVKSAISKNPAGNVVSGGLSIGMAVHAGNPIGCDGILDDVRLSKITREIHDIPNTPLQADAHTIGLWSFDLGKDVKEFADASNLANPMRVQSFLSLSEADRVSYKAGPAPWDSQAEVVPLAVGAVELPRVASPVILDGPWELVEGGAAEERLSSKWDRPLPAVVPGSVHTALLQAGVIPFPYHGRNQEIAREWSFKTYWYKKTFLRPPKGQDHLLVFDGVCNRCTVWLNGKQLGSHEGMFDPIEFPLDGVLQDENTLIVKLDPAIDWQQTVVFNNSYGWHYSKFPPLGIWRAVKVCGKPAVEVRDLFLATRDAKSGLIDLMATLSGSQNGLGGKLRGVLEPENFAGSACHFEYPVNAGVNTKNIHLQLTVPNPQLWWPVDLGKPNLYKLKTAFLPEGGGAVDLQQITFGIRTIQMAPVNGRPHPKLYDWTFVINGQPTFIKGAGWCTCDAMMDFSRARYDRLLTLAAAEHNQMLRAWGSGMVETDDFYDLCDRKGIMVMQEWPTAWESHLTQPFDMLERTVREGILRLRSHPSLAIYTGGNESVKQPFGKAIDMMGRLNIELDGTRDFHRGEPWGGSRHDYDVYWGGAHLDHSFVQTAVFYGEFGIASYPCYESVQRFLPDGEKSLWPPPPDGSFAYHTPIFNTSEDLNRLTKMSQYFTTGKTMERFVVGTQLAQTVGVRHALERARSRWPECTGALYYKLNDNSPAASWSTVDWYGAPKISHYLIQDSFAPLTAVALFSKATSFGEPLSLPVFLLDDADVLHDGSWNVFIRAYGADLKQIKQSQYHGEGSIGKVARLGEFTLTAEQSKTSPLLVTADVLQKGVLAKRNYYFTNFETDKDCLFDLPRTKLAMQIRKGKVVVKNEGTLPAVGVEISLPGHLEELSVENNYFWLEPGETKTVSVNMTEGLSVKAWNAETVGL